MYMDRHRGSVEAKLCFLRQYIALYLHMYLDDFFSELAWSSIP